MILKCEHVGNYWSDEFVCSCRSGPSCGMHSVVRISTCSLHETYKNVSYISIQFLMASQYSDTATVNGVHVLKC